MKKIIFIANNNLGQGLSGGDRIFLEFLKHWQHKSQVTVFACQETINLINNYNIKNIKIIPTTNTINNSNYFLLPNLLEHIFKRTIKGVKIILKNKDLIRDNEFIYSVSDFYPDFFPALICKFINPKIKFISGYYLFSPNPFSKKSPYIKGNFIKGLLYWLMQQPSYMLTKIFADIVFVTSEPDVKKFSKKKTVIIQGGVDTQTAIKYFKNKKKTPKKYDAVFIGRLHPQKGVLELVDIWKRVVKTKPNALLAIIGDGELENKLKNNIKQLKLDKNITLLGFLDGTKKYKIFKQSRIVLHPAIYDSGGMAAAEAMAWGLPGVSFNLPALKSYYPKGMIKSKCFNHNIFSKNILSLLNNPKKYQKYSQEARQLILNQWDWYKKATDILKQI